MWRSVGDELAAYVPAVETALMVNFIRQEDQGSIHILLSNLQAAVQNNIAVRNMPYAARVARFRPLGKVEADLHAAVTRSILVAALGDKPVTETNLKIVSWVSFITEDGHTYNLQDKLAAASHLIRFYRTLVQIILTFYYLARGGSPKNIGPAGFKADTAYIMSRCGSYANTYHGIGYEQLFEELYPIAAHAHDMVLNEYNL